MWPFFGSMEIETKNVAQVVFGLQSPQEIRNQAVVEITSEETFANGRPVDGGLFDLKMGPVEASDVCATCGLDRRNCVGHFGYFQLTSPLYHPSYGDIIKKVIESICSSCSEVLLDDRDKMIIRNYKRSARLGAVKAKIKTRPFCVKCDLYQKTVKRDKSDYQFKVVNEEGKKEILPTEVILKMFKRINPSDAELLGFSSNNRPEWMILTNMVVSPPVVRPTIVTDNNQRGEDDLTIHLSLIIKMNKTLRAQFDKSDIMDKVKNGMIEMLQYYISAMTLGTTRSTGGFGGKGNASRTGKPLKSINDRISGKQGRFRKHIMGKRVDFSARSVITPDPNLDLDQLGVPMDIAKIMTFPEIVNELNKDRIYRYIANAKIGKYPMGICHKRGSHTRTIAYVKEDIVLETGDVVSRQLIDGDITLFNRQPTLHKPSMQGFKCKVMSGKTFRINLSVTTPSLWRRIDRLKSYAV